MAREPDQDELIDRWTLVADEPDLVAGKRGATRLGFALLLRFYTENGRFPRGRGEIPAAAVDYVGRQVGVPAAELGFYEWSGRTIEFHRSQIRRAVGFRECTVADADALTGWLTEQVTQSERDPDVVREKLLGRCLVERIEPPTTSRIDRIVRSALHRGEELLFAQIHDRLPDAVADRLTALVAGADPVVDAATGEQSLVEEDEAAASLLAVIRSAPGNVSLNTMLSEVAKLRAVRAVGLPAGLFVDVAPKVLAGWRARAAVESPSHLRQHPQAVGLTLLAALLFCREREITDTLV
ncbi:MAG: DUF4158 domain-containing protein, partial [Actinomycetia bacterium]|nr:DUF4158 domain-containing protein [Actinomycetes bacterium]